MTDDHGTRGGPTAETGVVRYDAMLRAIAECKAVDELKDYRDKARALELYAQQARNREAEAQAAEIRIRAERQCKILIRQEQAAGTLAERGRPGEKNCPEGSFKTLSDLNVSHKQSMRWGGLADLSDDEFEKRLAAARERGDVPSTAGISYPDEPPPRRIDVRELDISSSIRGVGNLDEYPIEEIIAAAEPVTIKQILEYLERATTALQRIGAAANDRR